MEDKEEGISLKEVFEVLWHKAWILAICAVVGGLLGFGLRFAMGTKYEATGTVLVSVSIETNNNYAYEKSNTMVSTVNSLVKKDSIITQTIKDLNLDISVLEFLDTYSISNDTDNCFVNVTCKSKKKDININIVNSILDNLVLYMNENKELYTLGSFEVVLSVSEYATYTIKEENHYVEFIIGGGLLVVCIASLVILVLNNKKK